MNEAYLPVIGLEVHVQLATQSKIFAPEGFSFGAAPNTHVSAVSLGHPGTLPALNMACIEGAIKLGLAANCHISPVSYFERKNYFYPDLPKGYQLSQDKVPICVGGEIEIWLDGETSRKVQLNRIHLEEDAGKSIHDQSPRHTMVDLNRAGTGLMEVVTEPDLHSPEEAAAFLAELRRMVRYLGISDGNMEEGSLRCDANISVKLKTAEKLGTKVEVKNMNSFTHVRNAIAYEIERQITEIEQGHTILQQTRTWNPDMGKTSVMRTKEEANDYRYFPDPDLPPVIVSKEQIAELQADQPPLPSAILKTYMQEFEIPFMESMALIEDFDTVQYMEALQAESVYPKTAANWLLGPVRGYLNAEKMDISQLSVNPIQLAKVIHLVESNQINFNAAKDVLFPALIQQPEIAPEQLANQLDLMIDTGDSQIEAVMDRLMEEFPDEVSRFRKGKKGLSGFFVGKIMRELKGKCDPKQVNQVVNQKLKG